MFGRTLRIALQLITTQLASGCYCCCERPFFWRKYQYYHGGNGCGCGEPCTTCCGSPAMPHGAPVMPVYGGTAVPLPAAPMSPSASPTNTDRMPPISSAVLSGSR
jgi:hypothetical protein